MTGPTKKVTSIPGAYAFEGRSYGPFEATGPNPYLEVPAALQAALGLPLHESEQVEAPEAEEGVDVQELLDANHDLAAERDELQRQVEELGRQKANAEADLQAVATERDQLQARVAELEGRPAPAPALPADLREQLLKVKGVGEALADQIIAAITPAPEGQPQ